MAFECVAGHCAPLMAKGRPDLRTNRLDMALALSWVGMLETCKTFGWLGSSSASAGGVHVSGVICARLENFVRMPRAIMSYFARIAVSTVSNSTSATVLAYFPSTHYITIRSKKHAAGHTWTSTLYVVLVIFQQLQHLRLASRDSHEMKDSIGWVEGNLDFELVTIESERVFERADECRLRCVLRDELDVTPLPFRVEPLGCCEHDLNVCRNVEHSHRSCTAPNGENTSISSCFATLRGGRLRTRSAEVGTVGMGHGSTCSVSPEHCSGACKCNAC